MGKLKKTGLVACGFLLGTAGVGILSSKDAKKCYTHITAAVLRCKDAVMKQSSILKENCQDIAADAQDINEKRYREEEEREIADAKEVLERAKEKETAA
jgi:hypothetical protein